MSSHTRHHVRWIHYIPISTGSTSLEDDEAAHHHNDADSTSDSSSWRQPRKIASVNKEGMLHLQTLMSESTASTTTLSSHEYSKEASTIRVDDGDNMDGGTAVLVLFFGLILIGQVALSERPSLLQEARHRNKKTTITPHRSVSMAPLSEKRMELYSTKTMVSKLLLANLLLISVTVCSAVPLTEWRNYYNGTKYWLRTGFEKGPPAGQVSSVHWPPRKYKI